MRLLVACHRATYISLIKKYPNGLPNRLQHYDNWVASWKDPHIHTYYDYFHNGQTRQHQMYMPNCAKANLLLTTYHYNFRPGIGDLQKNFSPIDQNFADDLELSQDISKITLRSFMQGFTKKETRTDHQLLLVWFVVAVFSLTTYLIRTVVMQDDPQDIVQLQPHHTYYHYQANVLRKNVDAAIEKINFLNTHSQDVLKAAKNKAQQGSILAGQEK